MAKVKNWELKPDASVTLKNIWKKSNEDASEETLWNTGLAASGEAHFDEELVNNEATIVDPEVYEKKHVAAVRLYKNNEYIYLNPGDTVTLTVKTAEAAAYYAQIQSDILEVTVAGVEEVEAEEETTEENTEEVPAE